MLKVVQIVLATVIAILLLVVFAPETEQNLEDFALGRETVSVWSKVDGETIHCSKVDDLGPCVSGVEKREAENVVLWLGNSQLHAINQFQAGQRTSTLLLHEDLRKHDLDLITVSPPNASLQEHYVIFEYLIPRLPIRLLLLGACFDDTRDDGLRGSIATGLADDSVRAALSETDIGKTIIAKSKTAKLGTGDTAGLDKTVQQIVEDSLNEWAAEGASIWRNRPRYRGQMFKRIYRLRNWVFGINPSSKRKKIASRYVSNFHALEEILTRASAARVSTLVYNIPIRNDIETPYRAKEYEQFKKDLERTVLEGRATYLNLEDLIPAPHWGKKDSTSIDGEAEVDFMHFQHSGHEILYRALKNPIEEHLIELGQ